MVTTKIDLSKKTEDDIMKLMVDLDIIYKTMLDAASVERYFDDTVPCSIGSYDARKAVGWLKDDFHKKLIEYCTDGQQKDETTEEDEW